VTAEEMLTYLKEIYDNLLKEVKAKREFKDFKMPSYRD